MLLILRNIKIILHNIFGIYTLNVSIRVFLVWYINFPSLEDCNKYYNTTFRVSLVISGCAVYDFKFPRRFDIIL